MPNTDHASSRQDDPRKTDERTADELDILILGPVPPPFGGISVHLSRLMPLLEEAGFKVGVLNHFESTEMPFVLGALNRNPVNYFRLPKKFHARIVHYHHSRWPQLMAVALGKGSSGARYIVTLHAGDIQHHFPQLTSRAPLVSRITRWALRRFDTVIVVDPKIASIVQDHVQGQKVELLPAFLESGGEEAESYDPSVEAFLSSGRVLVLAAYGVQFLPNGSELYGLDTAIEAFVNLAGEREDLRLAVFVARPPSGLKARRHLARLERRLEQAEVRNRVLIVFGLPLVSALRDNAVFIRPTRAEGDAVSVREAQRAGVPVIASDIIRRPDGVVLFPAESVPALCVALRGVLDDSALRPRAAVRRHTQDALGDSFSDKLIRLYRTELASQARAKRVD